jgi:hypothetical protein
MGCTSCGSKSVVNQNIIQNRPAPVSLGPCVYTKMMLEVWLLKLTCIKESDKYQDIGVSLGDINASLGVVISALKNESKICYFASHLDNISAIIIKIANLGEC